MTYLLVLATQLATWTVVMGYFLAQDYVTKGNGVNPLIAGGMIVIMAALPYFMAHFVRGYYLVDTEEQS